MVVVKVYIIFTKMEKQLSPAMLPIAKYQTDILDLIDGSPAVVISGKTGCGKSTQVPQYILNRHPNAKVVICQPRRVAATSLAVRVSEELKCKLGKKVGYHIGMQSFKEESCSIIYMTYGILIQQLLFKDNLQYTHIILDQIHQRSLEMDFTFVALKKMINDKYKNKIKLIVMSATLNADLFCNYFATNNEGKFYLCQLRQTKGVQQQSRRGGRFRGEENEDREHFQVLAAGKQYKPALKLQLQQQKLFKVQQYYLQDLKQKDYYYGQQEQRIPQEMYRITVDIIKNSRAKGDYLIFLPGLLQIRTLKNLLINHNFNPHQIIQVHSLFSDELYHHLFNPNIKNKLILATNIGQSSITLPFCCIVIDFCLSRKNYSRDRGVTRLETRLASQANLIQRSGRVGRVSDGKVYRLITRQLYNQLPQYQKPEIQCVSLEMIILRVKQLDFTNKNQFFKNPYYFLMSTINPPDIYEIRKSLEILIQEQAISGQSEKSINVRNADQLFLTEMGKFMVQMPCELRISKMVLMGLKVRIPIKIISIACILMLSKQFFVHEERRYNNEEFMHSLIGYDRGYFNDYLLRQNVFSHWREEFYQKAKQKKLFRKKKYISKEQNQKIQNVHRIYQTEEGVQEILSFLQEFNQEKWSQRQKQWCSIRGVSPNIMRQLIRLQQNLRLKVISKNLKFPQKEKAYNELVLLCLEYGFPDNDCDVKWPHLNQQMLMNPKEQLFYIDIANSKQTHDDLIHQYVQPQKDYQIQVLNNKTKRVYGNNSVLSKFLLPKHFSKAQIKNTSHIYQYLSKGTINHHFSSEFALRGRPITILNESICKSILPYDERKKFRLITHRFTEIGNKKLVGMGCLVEQQTFLMIQLILIKNIELLLHPSQQYFCGFRTHQSSYSLSTILDQPLIEDILYYRELISQKKHAKLSSSEEMMSSQDALALYELLKAHNNKRIERQVWEHKYLLEVKADHKNQYFPINKLPKLKNGSNYYESYKSWKMKKYCQFYNEYRPLIMENIYIICRRCSQQIVQIEQLSFYNHVNATLKLNQYSGSWKINQNNKVLTCKYGHQVGKVISEDEALINKKTIMLYIPYNRIEDLWGNQWKSQAQIAQMIANGKQELQNYKNRLQYSECLFCYQFSLEGGEATKIFDKRELGKNYLKKYMEHMRSQQHLNNIAKFRSNLNL